MQLTVTEDQVVEAAQALGQDEFTRADVAGKLGVEKPEIKQAFVHAKKAGRLEKTRDDEDNTGHFRLT
jgi:DNA-binding transcriptional regulator LsrR (DeoR family)